MCVIVRIASGFCGVAFVVLKKRLSIIIFLNEGFAKIENLLDGMFRK